MRYKRIGFIGALIAALVMGLETTPRAQIVSAEREILIELFNATGGPNWKRKGGWGSDKPVCAWEGVVCGSFAETGPLTRLELWDNNLKGVLPVALARLTELQVLNLSGNQLTGALPAEFLERANDNKLDLHFWGNELSDLLTKVSIRLDSFIGICYPEMQLQFAAEIDGPAKKAVYQSAHCGSGTRQAAYCLKGEFLAPPMDDISRALRRLDFASAAPRYSALGGFADHSEYLRTAVTWGGGVSQVVRRTGGQAPMNVWTAQRLLLGLVPTNWERGAKRVSCDTLKWPEG